uniref:Uncharacterized protein n=1 Tax=Timema cristinae TaxID=61476 RepID=A0A7R9DEX9_TIMCR|nr:unnamed protein product [Timema cristinae]
MPEGAGAKELKDATSNRLHIVPLDVTKQDDVDKVVEHVKDTLGDQDLWAVINNAGIFTLGEVELMPLEVFHRINEVNTIGSVRVTKAFLSLIRKSKGRFVFTASVLGRITVPGVVPYSMSKHAIVSFIDGLRREVRKWSVTVHGIEPMAYRTPMANMKPHQNFLKHQWSEMSEEVQQLYGDSYVENYMTKINGFVRTGAYHNLDEVVNDLVDAAVGATPRNMAPGAQKFIAELTKVRLLLYLDLAIDNQPHYTQFLFLLN